MRFYWLTVLLTVVPCSDAFADWEFTKWGMSKDQVVQASGGRAKPYPAHQLEGPISQAGEICTHNIPDYVSGKFRFEAQFCFDRQDRLSRVRLRVADDRFVPLEEALNATYGAPVNSQKNSIVRTAQWNDTKRQNRVRLLGISDSTFVDYEPDSDGALR
jgi:hypothetical protein